MDVAYQYAQWIEDMFSYTLGTDLFVGQLPNSVESGVYIDRIGGTLDLYSPMSTTFLDVYMVDTRSQDAFTSLEAIKRATHRMIDTQPSGDVQIYSMIVVGDIEHGGRDLEEQAVLKFTVEIYHRATALIS